MKRDMELVRRILLELSGSSQPLDARTFVDGNTTLEEVIYHFRIMEDGGLIKASVAYAGNKPYICTANELTWAGNDFLASIRSNSIWSKVKTTIAKATGDASLDVIKALAEKISTNMLLSSV